MSLLSFPLSQAVAPTSTGEWMSATLMRAFVSLDKEFAAISEGTYVGTTAVVVVLGRQRMWVAHCGEYRDENMCMERP